VITDGVQSITFSLAVWEKVRVYFRQTVFVLIDVRSACYVEHCWYWTGNWWVTSRYHVILGHFNDGCFHACKPQSINIHTHSPERYVLLPGMSSFSRRVFWYCHCTHILGNLAKISCNISQNHRALLSRQRALLEFNLLDVLSRHYNQPNIAAIPRHRCRWVSRLFNRLTDSLG
jgi:hypothetical protein